jgi:hypothetical protein
MEREAACGMVTIKKPLPFKIGNAADSSRDPLMSGFPTLVLSRSGCEGRPIIRTLSLKAPLAIERYRITPRPRSQSAIRPIPFPLFWAGD